MTLKPKKKAGLLVVCLLLMFMCSLALGQQEKPHTHQRGRTQHSQSFVRLILLNADREPLADCAVQISIQQKTAPPEQWKGVTSKRGVVSVPFALFKGIDEGSVHLTVETEAYSSQQWIEKDSSRNDLPLTLELQLTRKPTIRLQLLKGAEETPLANSEVHLISNNGMRCIIPCPKTNNQKKWTGRTDATGTIEIPRDFIQMNTWIEAGLWKGYFPSERTRQLGQSLSIKLSQE
ncbi:MAG TPA: hypothetical protein VFZ34_13360 [Blastocatellia bacterium]|nr:hypothetical protein [Blastocatellia bacterium]